MFCCSLISDKCWKWRKLQEVIKSAWQQKTQEETEPSDIRWDKEGRWNERESSQLQRWKGGKKMLTGASDGRVLSVSLWEDREQVQRGEKPKSKVLCGKGPVDQDTAQQLVRVDKT